MSLSYAPGNQGYDSNIPEVSELTSKVNGWASPRTIAATEYCRQLKRHVGKSVRDELHKTYPGIQDSTLYTVQESIDTVAQMDKGAIAKLNNFLYGYKQEEPPRGKYSGGSITIPTPDPSLQGEHFHQTHTIVMEALDTLFSEGESDEYRSNILSSAKLRAKKEECIEKLQLYLERKYIHDWRSRPPIEQVAAIIDQVLSSEKESNIVDGVSNDIQNKEFASALIKLVYMQEGDLGRIAINVSPQNVVDMANFAGIEVTINSSGLYSQFIIDEQTIPFGNGTQDSIKRGDKSSGISALLKTIQIRNRF